MSQNLFAKTMSSKTEAELKEVLSENSPYVDEARAAAANELEQRNGQLVEESTDDTISGKPKGESLEEQYEPVFNKSKKYITEDSDAPELYTKTAITLFSALFSTIFGAALLMSNLKTLNKNNARIWVLAFGIFYTIGIISINEQFVRNTSAVTLLNILGAVVLNEFFWNNHIGKTQMHRKKKIWKPLIISIIISIPLLLAVIYG